MKTYRFTHLVTVLLGLAAFSTAGCAEKAKVAETPLPAVKQAAPLPAAAPEPASVKRETTPATPVAPQPATAGDVAVSPGVSSAQWLDIKDNTYDTRATLFAGFERLVARVDEQIVELTAKRAAMPSTAYTKDWDFAMKEMENARSYLKGMGEELNKATAQTWDQQKEKVGQAWTRTQEAYAKVKASTTS